MKPMKRPRLVPIQTRISPLTSAALSQLAETEEVSISDVVRYALDQFVLAKGLILLTNTPALKLPETGSNLSIGEDTEPERHYSQLETYLELK